MRSTYSIIYSKLFVTAWVNYFFAEELAIVIEVNQNDVEELVKRYGQVGVNADRIGTSIAEFGRKAVVSFRHMFLKSLRYM